jgi:hypothetical protein
LPFAGQTDSSFVLFSFYVNPFWHQSNNNTL